MDAVVFRAPGEVACASVPEPSIEHPGDVIVDVALAGLCGSDLHPFFGREQGLDAGTVMGHEFVGHVLEAGPAVTSVSVGDRVCAPFSTSCGTCDDCQRGLTSRCAHGQLFGWRSGGRGLHGGQAERVRVPLADGTVVRVPDALSSEVALLLGDNASTAWYCADLAEIRPDGVTVVVGCGPVGLLGIRAAQHHGAGAVVAVDPDEARRAHASAFGAHAVPPGPGVVRVLASLGAARGAASVMEFVGLPDAQRLAYDVVRPGGTLATIGCHCGPFAFTAVEAYDKNLTYRTGRCPARHYMGRLPAEAPEYLADVAAVITHRFTLDQGVEAYDVFAHHRDGCLKAVFTVGGYEAVAPAQPAK